MPCMHGPCYKCTSYIIQCKPDECSHRFCYRCLSKWGRVIMLLFRDRAIVLCAGLRSGKSTTKKRFWSPNTWNSLTRSFQCPQTQNTIRPRWFKLKGQLQLFSIKVQGMWYSCCLSTPTSSICLTFYHFMRQHSPHKISDISPFSI